MRRIWWFAIGGGLVLAGLLVVLGFAFLGGGDGGGGSNLLSQGCTPEAASTGAGNANVAAQARGKGYARKIVILVTDKQSGAPVHGAKVSVQGVMDCPHYMPLYQKNLREASTGTYQGDYQLIMQGHWTMRILVRSKQNGSTTAALPVTVKIPG